MFLQAYVIVCHTSLLFEDFELMVSNIIKDNIKNPKIHVGIKCLDDKIGSFYPEGYRPVILTYSEDTPHDLDKYIKRLFMRIDSPPCDFKLTKGEAASYFRENPLLFLLSEYETDYSEYGLDSQWLATNHPELYHRLVHDLKLKF